MVGNPNFIAVGWGETTKAFKLPVRIGERIQQLKAEGEDSDVILARLRSDFSLESSNCSLQIKVMQQQQQILATLSLLSPAVTLKSKGGSYARNNATELKRTVEEAIALLQKTMIE